MVKTQIQLPEELYRRLKSMAAEKEWSLAETLRRGAEILLASRPVEPRTRRGGWKLEAPANTRLIADPFANPRWREEANLGAAVTSVADGHRHKRGRPRP